MIFILNLIRHATLHGHNSMYVRRPDPFPFREGCGYARLHVKGYNSPRKPAARGTHAREILRGRERRKIRLVTCQVFVSFWNVAPLSHDKFNVCVRMYAIFTGIVESYILIQATLWWIFHIFAVFWKVQFQDISTKRSALDMSISLTGYHSAPNCSNNNFC